jgi:cytochrome c oxidase assembly factor CtaG
VSGAAAVASLVGTETAMAHGDRVAADELASAWTVEPAVVGPSALALALVVHAWVRLRRRGRADHAPAWRLVAFTAGLALTVLPLVSPLDAIGEEYLLSGHMLQHVLIGDAGPALMLAALSGPLLFFVLPAPLLGSLARSTSVRAVLRVLSRPVVAVAIWCAAIAVWHVPALYELALREQWAHDLEHASFVAAGSILWYQLVDPARREQLTRGGRIAVGVVALAAGQVLSSVLLFAGRVLYEPYALQDERLLGLSALTDQRLAGAVMMAEQVVAIGTLSMLLLLAADQEARADAPRSAPAERGA